MFNELLILLGGLALIIKGGDPVPGKSPLKASFHHTIAYIDSLNFTEPSFVFVVMAITATRPDGRLAETLLFGATGLTVLTENAALTHLGSLVEAISDELKQALVAGAVTGGG